MTPGNPYYPLLPAFILRQIDEEISFPSAMSFPASMSTPPCFSFLFTEKETHPYSPTTQCHVRPLPNTHAHAELSSKQQKKGRKIVFVRAYTADYTLKYEPSTLLFTLLSILLSPESSKHWPGMTRSPRLAGESKSSSRLRVISSSRSLWPFWTVLSPALGSFLPHRNWRLLISANLQSSFFGQLTSPVFCSVNSSYLDLSRLPALLLNLGQAPDSTWAPHSAPQSENSAGS